MILETLVAHGSDFIEWIEGSGFTGAPLRRIPPARLVIAFSKAPRDLHLEHKPAVTALWRKRPAELLTVVPGRAGEADLAPPKQAVYTLEGTLLDATGQCLPRRFKLDCGSATGHRIALYRSPLGSRYGSAGGLFGRVGFDGGKPAPWSIVIAKVSPPLGAPLEFTAQADAHGEFILPLDRIPAIGVDAIAKTYPATLRILASPLATPDEAFDPDTHGGEVAVSGRVGAEVF